MIRNVPRIPEHCIVYALKIEWPLLQSFTSVDEFVLGERKEEPAAAAAGASGPTAGDDEEMTGSVSLDKDNVHHMTWIYNRAAARAAKFGIKGVTYNLTMQVVKNVIPAIASTNALISAACVGEALKFRTGCAPTLNNYFMYIGGSQTGINTETIEYKQNPECAVCQPPLFYTLDPMMTLDDLLKQVEVEKKLEKPSLMVGGTFLYLSTLHADYAENLTKCLGEVLESGQMCVVNDQNQKTVKVIVKFAE
jgi:ubiquitin-activating enzyme E1 C